MPYSPDQNQFATDFRGATAIPGDRIVSAIPSKYTTAPEMRVGVIDEFVVNQRGEQYIRVKWALSSQQYSSTYASTISVNKNVWMKLSDDLLTISPTSEEEVERSVIYYLRNHPDPVTREQLRIRIMSIHNGMVGVGSYISQMAWDNKITTDAAGFVHLNV